MYAYEEPGSFMSSASRHKQSHKDSQRNHDSSKEYFTGIKSSMAEQMNVVDDATALQNLDSQSYFEKSQSYAS